MFQVPSAALFGLTLCILLSHKTMAQQFSGSGVVYEAARNKIGLIRYCRKNELLDPALADRTVLAMEAGLRADAPGDAASREQGDRAQQAGEDGFWETGRRRDLAGVAKLFGTTPADLCREWADETLRAQAPRERKEAATIAVAAPVPSIRPAADAAREPADPAPDYRPPSRARAAVKPARPAGPPPLPSKAAVVPAKAVPVSSSSPRAAPRGDRLASTGKAVPFPERPAGGSTAAFPREQPAALRAPLPRADDQPLSTRENWPFNRFGRSDRCLLAGCKWPALQERPSWRY